MDCIIWSGQHIARMDSKTSMNLFHIQPLQLLYSNYYGTFNNLVRYICTIYVPTIIHHEISQADITYALSSCGFTVVVLVPSLAKCVCYISRSNRSLATGCGCLNLFFNLVSFFIFKLKSLRTFTSITCTKSTAFLGAPQALSPSAVRKAIATVVL